MLLPTRPTPFREYREQFLARRTCMKIVNNRLLRSRHKSKADVDRRHAIKRTLQGKQSMHIDLPLVHMS